MSMRYKTKKGMSRVIYYKQIDSSIKRKDPLPNYTLEEFRVWLFSRKNFNQLFKNWIESNYYKWLKPSADRINDYLPYTLDNLRLVTWKENYLKYINDKKNGINNKVNISVLQYDLNGNFIKEFYSVSQAMRETGVDNSHISAVCRGKRKTAGCFKWVYR